MSPPSPLLALPSELRVKVWRHLLCPCGTVDLHVKSDSTKYEYYFVDEDVDSDEVNEEYKGRWGPVRAICSKSAIPVSILRVNQQLHNECSPFLYSNRLHFHDAPPPRAIRFLSLRPARDRAHIRHLGFGSGATSADDMDVTRGWERMHKYIATELTIKTVTIWAPQADTDEWHWCFWSVRELVRILLDGGIESVRLLFGTYEYSGVQEFTEIVFDPITLPKDAVLEELPAMDVAIYRPSTEEEVAMLTYVYHTSRSLGSIEYSIAYKIWFQSRLKKKTRLPLKVEREDMVGGDEGSVVVLRKEGWIAGRIVCCVPSWKRDGFTCMLADLDRLVFETKSMILSDTAYKEREGIKYVPFDLLHRFQHGKGV